MKTIVLDAPGKNSLSSALMEKVIAEVKSAGDAPLFITGAGDTFSAGLNLKEVASLDAPGMIRFLGLLEDMVTALFEHPAPTMAYVNGHAIAGGCVVAMCCDFRLMTARPGARFGLNEVAIGLRFPPRTLKMLQRRVTAPVLARIVLESNLMTAPEAHALGLVDALGEEADARARLELLAGHPRDAYAAAKRSLVGTLEIAEADRKSYLESSIPVWASEELKAGIRAMLKK
jgi:enoyl-CoA hydratase/carnithine racemase